MTCKRVACKNRYDFLWGICYNVENQYKGEKYGKED